MPSFIHEAGSPCNRKNCFDSFPVIEVLDVKQLQGKLPLKTALFSEVCCKTFYFLLATCNYHSQHKW